MPSQNFAPRTAFLGGCDVSAWSGTTVATRAGQNITISAFHPICTDVVEFLNFRRSVGGQTLGEAITAGWTGGATVIDVGIHPVFDRIFIHSTAHDFGCEAMSSGDVWGMGTTFMLSSVAVHPITGVAGNLLVFPHDWIRGNIGFGDANTTLRVTPTGHAPYFPSLNLAKIQGVITTLRASTLNDLDSTAPFNSLEDLDNAAYAVLSPGFTGIRWGLNDDGYVFHSHLTAIAAPLVWTSTSFRDRLGFDGTESEITTTSGYSIWTAKNPCPGVLIPTRSLQEGPEEETVDVVRTLEKVSGSIASIVIASWIRWRVVGQIDGPADSVDLGRHYVERCFGPYGTWHAGSPMTIVPEWGDGRRMKSALGGDAYSTLYTTQEDGIRGRIVGQLAAATQPSRKLAWGSGFRRALPFEMVVQVTP